MPAWNLIAGATRRLVPAAVLSLVLVVPLGAATAEAATAFTTYAATLSGQHGTAKLTTFTSGAGSIQVFWRVVLPVLIPAIFTGFSLSFARAVGEYGSVIFISSRKAGDSLITADLIWHKIEGSDEAGATALGVVMLVISFLILIGINSLQWWTARRYHTGGA